MKISNQAKKQMAPSNYKQTKFLQQTSLIQIGNERNKNKKLFLQMALIIKSI